MLYNHYAINCTPRYASAINYVFYPFLKFDFLSFGQGGVKAILKRKIRTFCINEMQSFISFHLKYKQNPTHWGISEIPKKLIRRPAWSKIYNSFLFEDCLFENMSSVITFWKKSPLRLLTFICAKHTLYRILSNICFECKNGIKHSQCWRSVKNKTLWQERWLWFFDC